MKTLGPDVPGGATVRKNVCIIGAGPAGITIAKELNRYKSVSVALLEGGFEKQDPETKALYAGRTHSSVLNGTREGRYLAASRRRAFGGAGAIWAGWCVPFTPHDFVEHSWVPHSGWPITRADIDPHYDRAGKLMNITPFDYDFRKNKEFYGYHLMPESDLVKTKLLYCASKIPRFRRLYGEEIFASPNVELFLGANVTKIGVGPDRSSIRSVEVTCLSGNRFTVKADIFVLCAGGIENARLLLASRDVFPNGVGNGHDLVGRFFMEHFGLSNAADLILTHPDESLRMYLNHYFRRTNKAAGPIAHGVLTLSEEVLERESLLNSAFYPDIADRGRKGKRSELKKALFDTAAEVDNYPGDVVIKKRSSMYLGTLKIRAEQSPNPESRVELADERDSLGMPRVKLSWLPTEKDWDSAYRGLSIIARELGRWSDGRLRIVMDRSGPQKICSWGGHHVGSTRMHQDPAKGVVDRDCLVHGLSNLYVAGSSVFPTCGFANPTFTIVALALRLSDRLKENVH